MKVNPEWKPFIRMMDKAIPIYQGRNQQLSLDLPVE